VDITASRSRGRWLRIPGVQARKEVVDRKDFDSMVCLALYALKNMLAMHFSKLKNIYIITSNKNTCCTVGAVE
jgi:hypothetical protein